MDDYGDGRDETKRKSRNQSEKKRRDQFNVLISELGTMVSGDAASHRKMDKTTVLLATIAFLKQHGEANKEHNSGTGSKTENSTSQNSKTSTEWKPSFLSDEEFVHLMLEAVDGFILVISLDDHGRILYASEGLACLLGHLPSKVIDANMTIFDLTSEDDTPIIKDILDERDSNNFMDQIERHHKEYFVHMEKGGANIIHNERARYELVKLSGYFAKWSSSNGSLDPCEDSKNCTDENCLPGSDDESMSIKSDISQTSKTKNHHHNHHGITEYQTVYVCTARLMAPQLVREMPVVKQHAAKGEFSSRYSLEWKFLFLDNRASPIIGYLSFEVLGTSGYDYYHADDLDRIVQCHESLMQTGEATSCYHRFLTKGQQWIWLQTRYFITYHQWNSKPEFVFATHHVVSYEDVVNRLSKERQPSGNSIATTNPGGGRLGGHEVNLTTNSADHRISTYPGPSSPTWSSRSSYCGSTVSTGTGIASHKSHKSQSSCRRSDYSETAISTHAPVSMASVSRSTAEVMAVSTDLPFASSFSSTTASRIDIESVDPSQGNFNFDLTNNISQENADRSASNQILMQGNPPIDVSGQEMRSQQVFMTPLQIQMHQQLKAKHAELFKRIMDQQEELRRVSEQLLMTQYGLVPVSVSPIATSHTATAATAVAVVSSDYSPRGPPRTNTEPGGGNLMVAQPLNLPPSNMQPQNNIFGNLEMPSTSSAVYNSRNNQISQQRSSFP